MLKITTEVELYDNFEGVCYTTVSGEYNDYNDYKRQIIYSMIDYLDLQRTSIDELDGNTDYSDYDIVSCNLSAVIDDYPDVVQYDYDLSLYDDNSKIDKICVDFIQRIDKYVEDNQ